MHVETENLAGKISHFASRRIACALHQQVGVGSVQGRIGEENELAMGSKVDEGRAVDVVIFAAQLDAVVALGPNEVIANLRANFSRALGVAGALSNDEIRPGHLWAGRGERFQQVVEMEILIPDRVYLVGCDDPGLADGIRTGPGDVAAAI